MIEDRLQLAPPLHLIIGQTSCWRCGADMPVVAVLCENIGAEENEPFILSNTTELPPNLTAFIQKRCPTYRLTYSKTVGGKYYANNCSKCGVISGDFFLHSEPGGPFFPTETEEAESLTLEAIPMSHSCFVQSGRGYGTGGLILQCAKRIEATSKPNSES